MENLEQKSEKAEKSDVRKALEVGIVPSGAFWPSNKSLFRGAYSKYLAMATFEMAKLSIYTSVVYELHNLLLKS